MDMNHDACTEECKESCEKGDHSKHGHHADHAASEEESMPTETQTDSSAHDTSEHAH